MRSVLATIALALLTTGCATPDSDPGDGRAPAGGSDHHPPPAPPTLFVSPSGQPFRARPGEPYPVVKWFTQADKNGDGRLDRAEFRADATAFFHILDKNGDGVIDGFEVTDYEQRIAPEIMGAYGSAGGAGRRSRERGGDAGRERGGASSAAVLQGAAVFGLLNEPEPVAAADLDLSGRITLGEWMTITDRRFDLLDTKQLGYLTLAGLPKTAAQILSEPGKHGRRNRDSQPGDGPPKDR